jgi:hypothetical protein
MEPMDTQTHKPARVYETANGHLVNITKHNHIGAAVKIVGHFAA